MRLFILLLIALIASPLVNASESTLNKKELNCLALNVYFEARGETTAGQLAVGMVTMNRVESRKFPNSICDVVWQRRQFSWTHDGRSDQPTDKKAWRLAKQIAKFIYTKYGTYKIRSKGALDLTQGALHYYAPDLADPRWAESKVVTRQIGGHLFLAERS